MEKGFDRQKFAAAFKQGVAAEDGGTVESAAEPQDISVKAASNIPVERPGEPSMEDVLRERAVENQKIIDETDILNVAKKSTDEYAPEKTIEDLKADLDGKRQTFAKHDVDISGRWNKLKKVLGFSKEEIKDSGVEEKKNEYKQALKKYLDAKRGSLGNITKEQAVQLYSEFTAMEAAQFLEAKSDESAKMKKEKGEWPEKVVDGYINIVKNFRDLSFKKKILISAGIMVGGAAAGLTFGVVGAGAFSLAGVAYRGVSGGASGLGLKKLMDTISAKREKKVADKEAESILSQDDWMNQLNAKLDEAVGSIDTIIGKMESKDLTRRRIATYTGIFVGSGAMAQIIQSTGLGGAIKEKLFGTSFAKPNVTDQIQESMKPSAIPESEVKSDGGMQDWMNRPAAGAEVQPSDVEGIAEGSVVSEEALMPEFKEIASVKIKAGGSMWGGIESNIRTNPAEYGLDPNDPDFTKDMHRMTKQILDEFAYRKGLTYEQLDQIARTKIRAGDSFRVIFDPSSEEIFIDDGDKLFKPKVSQALSSEEIVSNKPKLASEDVKSKAGVADHYSSKGTGQMKVPQDIQDWQDRAKARYAETVDYEKRLGEFHKEQSVEIKNNYDLAHIDQVRATGRGINRIFEGAGVSKWADVLNRPMSEWSNIVKSENYIVQDVGQMDEINKLNPNLDKLRKLYPILKGYSTSGNESIGECLSRAMKDAKNVVKINRLL